MYFQNTNLYSYEKHIYQLEPSVYKRFFWSLAKYV